MHRRRNILIVLVILVTMVLVWFFRPYPPSGLKEYIQSRANITAIVKVRHLWDQPFMAIASVIPGFADSIPSLPTYLRPILPPSAELYLLKMEEGEGWVMAIDLGWRSRLFRLMHRTILEQIQYRGFGAIEGEHTVRTPSGVRFLVHQDAGTLFLVMGKNPDKEILSPALVNKTNLSHEQQGKENIFDISFSNTQGEFTRRVEEVERDIEFVLLPSVSSISDGRITVRYADADILEVEISITVIENGDRESVEADISYILDLIDRFLFNLDFSTEVFLSHERDRVSGRLVIHPIKKQNEAERLKN